MTLARTLLAVALATGALAARAQDAGEAGTTIGIDLGMGVEPGAAGKKSMLETEGTLGWAFANRVRPELGFALGFQPDSHVAFRPGVRVPIPQTPAMFRVALDASNARDEKLGWRFILLGASAELRASSTFSLMAEADTGIPLRGSAGIPILVRFGAVIRP